MRNTRWASVTFRGVLLLLLLGPMNSYAQDASLDLAVSMSGSPGSVAVGANVTYTITVSGPTTATGVSIWDVLPAGVTYVSGSVGATSCDPLNQLDATKPTLPGATLVCPVGNLSAGIATATIVVKPTLAGTITNIVGVAGDQYDATMSNNSAIATTTVSDASGVSLYSLSLSPTSVVGGQQNSTATVTLTAPAPTNGINVALSSGNTAAATVPDFVPVAQGSAIGTASVTTLRVSAQTQVAINARYGADSRIAVLTITAAPVVNSVSLPFGPTSGGQTVTINGAGFTGATGVKFGDVFAFGPVVVDDGTMRALTPPHGEGKVDVSVVTPWGTGTLSNGYEYWLPPGITSISPTAGSTAGGTAVTVNGAGFRAAIAVKFGGVAAGTPGLYTQSQLTAVTGAHPAPGIVDVVVTNPDGQSNTLSGGYIYTYPLSSLTVNPASVAGGDSATGTVTLGGTAPAGGALVALSNGNTRQATIPATVTIPQNQSTATFTVTTSRNLGPTPVPVPVTATYSDSSVSATLNVTRSTNRVVAFRITSTTLGGSRSTVATIDLDAPAPAGGTVVALSSSNPAVASVPPTVTVPQDAISASFTITTSVVTTTTTVTLTATYGGTSASGAITVLSPAFEGYLDRADCNNISGWAWDSYRPNTPINVDILVDGTAIAWGVPANIDRPDLVSAGKGDGRHGFGYPTPAGLDDDRVHTVAVYYSSSVPPTQLGTSPMSISCAQPSVSIEWIRPAEVSWGPAGTLTVAGHAQNGTGGVSMWWRDATINGPFNPVGWAPIPDDRNQWSNTIPSTNNCHTYQVLVAYSVADASATYNGDYCVSAIQVQAGTYGSNCGASYGNATWSLAPSCNGQSACWYAIDHTILGDPAPGCAKDFWAEWTCGSSTLVNRSSVGPEAGFGSLIYLSCQ